MKGSQTFSNRRPPELWTHGQADVGSFFILSVPEQSLGLNSKQLYGKSEARLLKLRSSKSGPLPNSLLGAIRSEEGGVTGGSCKTMSDGAVVRPTGQCHAWSNWGVLLFAPPTPGKV